VRRRHNHLQRNNGVPPREGGGNRENTEVDYNSRERIKGKGRGERETGETGEGGQ